MLGCRSDELASGDFFLTPGVLANDHHVGASWSGGWAPKWVPEHHAGGNTLLPDRNRQRKLRVIQRTKVQQLKQRSVHSRLLAFAGDASVTLRNCKRQHVRPNRWHAGGLQGVKRVLRECERTQVAQPGVTLIG